ncbi:MAG: low molecular weight protein arginine phosphatase [Firmicutes bacterium]|nr:low molecular weight protein arginine phosphatase [Bacillota bacterium]
MKRILLVCTGNTCRSPMAEALAKPLLKQLDLDLVVSSAGTYAVPGDLASEAAIEVLGEEGLDLAAHRARALTPEMVEEADLIITMTWRNREHVLGIAPWAEKKMYLLKELAEKGLHGAGTNRGKDRKTWDITDPLGSPVTVYREVKGELKRCLLKALKHIKEQEGLG